MFKKKKRSEEGASGASPGPLRHSSSSSAVGEGVEFDKFDPEVNKGVFRKRDAHELLAALSSGDLDEDKKGKKKRTHTSPRPMESTTPRSNMQRSSTVSVLEAVEKKGEEKEDRFIQEMDRLLDEYEGAVHCGTSDSELQKGRSPQDVRSGLRSSRSTRLEKRVCEADIDSGLEALLGEDSREHTLEEFDDSLALDVLSLRKEFEVLTEEEEKELKKRNGIAPDTEVQGEADATAELLAAAAQFESAAAESRDQERDVAPAPLATHDSVALMDSQALKDAILADIGDGKGTSSSKIKLQRNSASEAFRNTSAKDLKKDLLSQLAGGATSFAAVGTQEKEDKEEEQEHERDDGKAAEAAALAVLAASAGEDIPVTPMSAAESGDTGEGERRIETMEEKEREDIFVGVPKEEVMQAEENDSNMASIGHVEERGEDLDEDLSDLMATLDDSVPGERGEKEEEIVAVPVPAETHDELERSRAQSVAVSAAVTAASVAAVAAVAPGPESVEGEKDNTAKKKEEKEERKSKKKKREGEKEAKKERKAKRKEEKRERGEGSMIGEGKERKHRTKEERRQRREERRERKASLASEQGSDASDSSHVSRSKSHLTRAKKSERKKHKRKHSTASVAGEEKHKRKHKSKKKKSERVQKEEKSESQKESESFKTKVERTPTLPAASGRDVVATASPGVVHSLPPPLKEEGEAKEEKKEMTEEEARAQKKNFRKSVYTLGPISEAGIGLDEFDFPDPEHIVPTVPRADSRGKRFEKDGKWYFRPLEALPPPREFWGREKKYVRLDMHTVFRYDVNAHIEEFNASSD